MDQEEKGGSVGGLGRKEGEEPVVVMQKNHNKHLKNQTDPYLERGALLLQFG